MAYAVYSGSSSRSYDRVDVTTNTSITLLLPAFGVRYYFAAKSIWPDGTPSLTYSKEVSATPPPVSGPRNRFPSNHPRNL